MKTLVIYDSQFGNTKTIAEEIARVLEEHGEVTMVPATGADSLIFGGEDLLVVGGPTIGHGLSPNMKSIFELVAAMQPAGPCPKALAFDTRIDWPKWLSGSAATLIGRHLEEFGCSLLSPPESFIVKGGEGPLKDGERERASAWARTVLESLVAADAPRR